ncbi:MAG: GNAT family N-acetyltransferase [Candidatus Dormiibacterota bacterium]
MAAADLVLREARADDAPQIAELFAELGYPLTAAEALERLGRGIETVFVAADSARLQGLLVICCHLPFGRTRSIARINAMVVRSQARRRGIGAQLRRKAQEWARSSGCEGIELTSGIRPERDAAHRFYVGAGFQRVAYRFWMSLED